MKGDGSIMRFINLRPMVIALVVFLWLSTLCGCAYSLTKPATTTTTEKTNVTESVSTTTSDVPPPTQRPQTTTASKTSTTTTITTTGTTAGTEHSTVPPSTMPTSATYAYSISGVPLIHQMPKYPTGCESVSAVMALKYWGESVSVDEFIDNHLSKSSKFYWKNGVYYGPDPYENFLGDPRSTQSYGCMAPVIEKALIHYFGNSDRVQNTTGTSLEELCKTYVDKNVPVLTWVTIGMLDSYPTDKWTLEDGSTYEWPANEHCMVLIGYDQNNYYFNDPYRGTVKKYAKWIVEKQYRQLGKQSLVITA